MTATEILALVKAGEEIIHVALRTWNAVKASGATTGEDAAVMAELDARSKDYDQRIARAKQRSG